MWTIDDCFALRLKKASEELMRYYTTAMEPCGITPIQYVMLFRIRELNGASMKEVAEALHIDKSTLARTIKPMMGKGLIADEKAPHARRSNLVVTAEGEKVLEYGQTLWYKAQQSIADRLGPDGIRHYDEVLNALKGE